MVNAAGYRGGELMPLIGKPADRGDVASVPRHRADPGARRDGKLLPILRDPDVSYYLRQEREGLILGPYEANAR